MKVQDLIVFAFVPSGFIFCQYCGYRSRNAIIFGLFISVPVEHAAKRSKNL